MLDALEVIPLKKVDGANVMDIEAILRRHPQVCLVDGLAYDNPPGSKNAHRWQDVADLLDAGISVITSINLQYIEEHRERVEKITGKHISETVPQSFLIKADEIAIVDAPPELCMRSEDSATPKQEQLSELREMRWF